MNKRYSCRQYDTRQHLSDLLAGVVATEELDRLQNHVADCDSCKIELESMAADDVFWKKASSLLGDAGSVPTMAKSKELRHSTISLQIDEAIAEESATPETVELLDPATHPEMLGRIGSFDVSEVIGHGGMGIVYKGFDTELNRPVAIKVLAPHLAANGIARKRFAREAQAAAAMQHPNIVPIHSVNTTAADSVSPNRPYLVMTLVSGKSLQANVEDNGPRPVKDVVRIAQQIAAGLTEAHKKGLVHRDIKPANILMENDVNRVMITDFGLARAANDVAVTQTGWLLGTPHYMSPEQVKGNEIDARSDLFSMGGVLYFLCTGREPFRGDRPFAVMQKIVNEEPVDAQAVNNEVPKTLSQIIQRLISKNVEQRFQSAAEVDDVLTRYLAHLQNPRLEPQPTIKVTNTNLWQNLWPKLLAVCAALLVGVIAVGWWQIQLAKPNPMIISSDNDLATEPIALANSDQNEALNGAPNQEASNDESDLQWMQGFVSFGQWQREAEQLDHDIKALEYEFEFPNSDTSDSPNGN